MTDDIITAVTRFKNVITRYFLICFGLMLPFFPHPEKLAGLDI